MRIKYIVWLLLLIGVSALVIHRISANNKLEEPTNASSSVAAIKVSGMVLRPQKYDDNISLSGTLEANEQIDLRSEVSGVVESINFKEGSKVKEGQILFSVNDIELQAQLSKVITGQKLAAENARRAKLLLEKQAISQEEYDIASADSQSARAESQLINAQIAKATVRAPFSGTIGLREISKGTYVTPLTPVAKLVNVDKLKITFSIPEKYASKVKLGAQLSFTTSDSDEEYSATIYAIEPEVEIATRTLKMRAVADNEEGKLFPGSYANVILPLETIDNALLVPSESLIPVQNGKKIFITENGTAKEVIVEVGARTGSAVRVISGLHEGDTILTYGVMALKNGTPVQVNLNEGE